MFYTVLLKKDRVISTKAFDWAVQCAKSVNGVVYLVDEDNKTEKEVFRVPPAVEKK